jgi:hypothetical protein
MSLEKAYAEWAASPYGKYVLDRVFIEASVAKKTWAQPSAYGVMEYVRGKYGAAFTNDFKPLIARDVNRTFPGLTGTKKRKGEVSW